MGDFTKIDADFVDIAKSTVDELCKQARLMQAQIQRLQGDLVESKRQLCAMTDERDRLSKLMGEQWGHDLVKLAVKQERDAALDVVRGKIERCQSLELYRVRSGEYAEAGVYRKEAEALQSLATSLRWKFESLDGDRGVSQETGAVTQ